MTTNNLGQWNLVTFDFQIIILKKTEYFTYDGKLLAINKAFTAKQHYLKDYKYEIFVPIDYYHFYYIIDKKNLSFNQILLAQKLWKYYFRIDYYQNKANDAIDVLF